MKVISPIAQSFYVEKPTGIFATSVELYFRDVDPSAPLKVQLRPMQNGKPSDLVYPFSEVISIPGQIVGSNNATEPTIFRFSAPVYLEGEKFHSIVIISNSDKYTVWTSKLGETDVTFSDESNQVIVSKQPLSGGIFKSQNNDSWVEEPYEDLTFKLYRAEFKGTSGNISLTNPTLRVPKNALVTDSLEMQSRKIKIGLSTSLNDPGLEFGNTISQPGSNATGNYVGVAGAIDTLSITNAGIDYTSGLYTNVTLTNITSEGYDASADITIENGVAIAATITSGGYGYLEGDVLSTNQLGSGVGRNLRFTVSNLLEENQLILDNVQGDFIVGSASTIQYTNSSNVITDLNGGGVTVVNDGIITLSDGLHIKVNQLNHGMHSTTNKVVVSGVISDIKPTKLSSAYTGETEISLESVSDFINFENQPVSIANPGYIKILGEILQYTGVSGNNLIGVSRDIDSFSTSTIPEQSPLKCVSINNYPLSQLVFKYELNGISLRRINKNHSLEDSTVQNSIGLDYYNIKIDMSQNGVDRSTSTVYPKLYFKDSKSAGGSAARASYNIQYESLIPNIKTLSTNGTNINASVRTVSGTSVSGNESSFEDQGFEDIELRSINYFDSPRLICSSINESQNLSALPNNKSLDLNLELTTTSPYISPVIDLDRAGIVFTSNRVNNVIEDYATDSRVSSIKQDPSAFTYVTNLIELEAPASSIKVILTASINTDSDIRALYAVQNEPSNDLIYYPFPGYKNLNNLGQVIDESLSDGTSDAEIIKTDQFKPSSKDLPYSEYEYTIDNVASFKYFSIKLIGSSTNQAFPPRIKNLRVLALA